MYFPHAVTGPGSVIPCAPQQRGARRCAVRAAASSSEQALSLFKRVAAHHGQDIELKLALLTELHEDAVAKAGIAEAKARKAEARVEELEAAATELQSAATELARRSFKLTPRGMIREPLRPLLELGGFLPGFCSKSKPSMKCFQSISISLHDMIHDLNLHKGVWKGLGRA